MGQRHNGNEQLSADVQGYPRDAGTRRGTLGNGEEMRFEAIP